MVPVEVDPFALTSDADSYVESESVETARSQCREALIRGSAPAVVGPTGLGKTLMLQLLHNDLQSEMTPLYVPFSTLAPVDLATLVVGLLERPAGDDPEKALLTEARERSQAGRPLVILIDDAAALPTDTAGALRDWLEAAGDALRVVLAGLPGDEFDEVLRRLGTAVAPIALDDGLGASEVARFIEGRLAWASAPGGVRRLFNGEVLAELGRVSQGNPRQLLLAAQAVVREAEGVEEDEEDAPIGEAPGTTASDLARVGEYRFVRGRFVDSETGEQAAPAGPQSVSTASVVASEAMQEPARRAPAQPQPERVAAVAAAGSGAADAAVAMSAHYDEPATRPSGVGIMQRFEDDDGPPVPKLPDFGRIGASAAAVAGEPGFQEAPEIVPPPANPSPTSSADDDPTWTQPLQFDDDLATPGGAADWLVHEDGTAASNWWDNRGLMMGLVAGCFAVVALVLSQLSFGNSDLEPIAVPKPTTSAPAIAQNDAIETIPARPAPAREVAAVSPPEVAPLPKPRVPPVDVDPIAAPPVIAAPTPSPQAPEPEPEPVAVEAPAPTPAAPMIGVAINATPWAMIQIDGQDAGETPLANVQISAGEHEFRATLPDGSERVRKVTISERNKTIVFE